jgi:copper resistance protein B
MNCRTATLLVALMAATARAAEDHAAAQQGEHGQHATGESSGAPQGESDRQHVPPAAPQRPMPEIPKEKMIELMQMADNAPLGMVLLDQLEWRDAEHGDVLAWNGFAWYGNDYDKAWLKLEGEYSEGDYTNRTELLWDRIITRRWSSQLGARHDNYFGPGPARTWAAFGVQGLAPYWFEIEATGYVGEEWRTAMRLSAELELLMTQRLILQPRFELNVYGRSDPDNGIGSGPVRYGAGPAPAL